MSGRSAIGASAKLPMKLYDAAWFRTFRSALGRFLKKRPTLNRTALNLVFHSGTKAYPGNFASKQMLKTMIEQFIAYFNTTMARPFRWTYAGKPLAG